jgi:uncharacterized protein (DUF58 family)
MSSDLLSGPSSQALEAASQDLVDKLPSLLLEARRVSATVAQGTHGRRRGGPGETFWQYRNFAVGDSAAQVDWRRSAGSSHLFVREREWEAAHTVWIWIDLSPSMFYRSHLAKVSKAERAVVLAMALASLLSDGGERVGVPGLMEPKARHNVAGVMMETLARAIRDFRGLPNPESRFGRHSEIVIFSDLLEPEPELAGAFGVIARQGVRGQIVQILDPAEESLPFKGRVEFLDDESGTRYVAERVETIRADYQRRLAAHKAGVSTLAARLGWSYFVNHSDRPAVEALLALHMHLSGLEKAYRAKGMLKGNNSRDDLS